MSLWFSITLVAIGVSLLLALARAALGPTAFDRVLAVNSIGTLAVLAICVYGFFDGRPEFLDIALRHQRLARGIPAPFVKAAHLAAEPLGRGGRRRRQDPRQGRLVAEQARLASHHEMLCAGEHLAIHAEPRGPPLRQALLAHRGSRPGAVAPEKQVGGTVAAPEGTDQGGVVMDIGLGHRKSVWSGLDGAWAPPKLASIVCGKGVRQMAQGACS